LRHSTILKGAPILVVEDDLIQALDLAESLKEAGASVLGPTSNLDEAVRVAQGGHCRGAILDFRLGARDAMPIAHEFQRCQIPFVIHSGYQCADQVPADWLGCKLVSKPANIPKLIRTMAALMRWRRLLAGRAAGSKRRPISTGHLAADFRVARRAAAWPDLSRVQLPFPVL
jgi:DNA-binding response OmpR family regulator